MTLRRGPAVIAGCTAKRVIPSMPAARRSLTTAEIRASFKNTASSLRLGEAALEATRAE